MEEVLDAAKETDHYNSELGEPSAGRVRGRGFASGYWFNVGLQSSVNLSLNDNGTVELVEGSTDIGGTRASIAMQTAETLGIAAEDVNPTVVDTDTVGFTAVTGGSRVTYATGYAAYNAAIEMIDKLKARAALLWNIDGSDVDFNDGVFSSKSDPELSIGFKDLAGKLGDTGGPVTSTGSVDLEAAGGAYGTHICDVEIDPETGKTDVVRYTIVQDAGRGDSPVLRRGTDAGRRRSRHRMGSQRGVLHERRRRHEQLLIPRLPNADVPRPAEYRDGDRRGAEPGTPVRSARRR